MNIKWDAQEYTDKFSFVHRYGSDLLSLLDIDRSMTCLDVGCGNGALTAELKNKGLSVIGMDASEDLLKIARERYPEIRFFYGDAADFTLQEPVDIVFSNAVFHWIDEEKQADMMRCIYKALVPGGQLVFECGGKGNNALIHQGLAAAFAQRGLPYQCPFYFPSIGESAKLMEEAGFQVVYGTLFERPTPLNGADGLYDWIQMFIKTPFNGMAAETKEEIIRQAVHDLEPELRRQERWYADYVRLRCKAKKI